MEEPLTKGALPHTTRLETMRPVTQGAAAIGVTQSKASNGDWV
jgi:hypothetical protein